MAGSVQANMRKLLLLPFVALALTLAACGGSGPAGGTTSAPDSGIEGIATLGPTCPVEQANSPCPDKPYEGTVRVVARGGDVVATVKTDSDGKFRVAVAPGDYTVDGGPPKMGGFPIAHPVEVTVVPHEFASVTIVFDTGIRMPAGS